MKVSCVLAGLLLCVPLLTADMIQCDNGDRYHGKILSMDETTVMLRNEITGTLSIPRHRIVSISFREPAVQAQPSSSTGTNSASALTRALSDAEAVRKVQNEWLATATPEANQMFNQMVDGLMSGQLNVADLKVKASETLQELRKLQAELGDDETAGLLNSYGAILENFLKQPAPATNRVPPQVTTPPASK